MFTTESGEVQNGIRKVRYSHDAMIDLLIAEPTVQQNTLAQIFERTPGWISQVINSDAFQARLAERKEELIDPIIRATINDRLKAVAAKSLEHLVDRLNAPGAGLTLKDDFLFKAAELSTKALGYGARPEGGGSNKVQVAVVVQVPPKLPSAAEWAGRYGTQVVEMPS